MNGPDWNRVHANMHDRVRAVACGVLRDRHEAEDAVQDTLLEAFRGIGSLRDERALPGWLLVIARSAAINRCRKLARRPQDAEPAIEPLDGGEGARGRRSSWPKRSLLG